MKSDYRTQTTIVWHGVVSVGFVFFLAGCGTYPVAVTHGPLPAMGSRIQGSVAVAPFRDIRPAQGKGAIGVVKGGFGNQLGYMSVNDGRPIQAVMQSFFEDAMRGAGYQIFPSNRSATIVEGDVCEWWVDSGWNYVVRIGVLVRVRDRAQGTILYRREIRGEEDDMMSSQNAIRAAVDVALTNALKEFSSPAFSAAVHRRSQ